MKFYFFSIFLPRVFMSGLFAPGIVNPVYFPFGPASPDYQKVMADLEADRGAFKSQGLTESLRTGSLGGKPTAFAVI